MRRNPQSSKMSVREVRPVATALLTMLLVGGMALLWRYMNTAPLRKSLTARADALRPELVRLPPGTFLMGSPETEAERSANEKQHEVEIRTAFAIAVTEVTQGQYERVMGIDPSAHPEDPEQPVENVSFVDAIEYCNRLSAREGLPSCFRIDGESVIWIDGLLCRGYRLPTEAEWEYAARAGTKHKYAGSDSLAEVGWFSDNAQATPHPVAHKRANAWGLYDFSGNVWEWVWDRYQPDYEALPSVDPIGPERGAGRIDRGGSWGVAASNARVAGRLFDDPFSRVSQRGFRVAKSAP